MVDPVVVIAAVVVAVVDPVVAMVDPVAIDTVEHVPVVDFVALVDMKDVDAGRPLVDLESEKIAP